MGAVTAIMHGDRDPSIAGMVLDSPFTELKVLAEELCSNFTKIPKFILSGAMSLIRKTIQSKAKFDINDLIPMNHVKAGFMPAFFVAGKQDTFIDPHHAKDLYEKYAGDKNIVIVDGDHNSVRPQFLLDSIAIFFFYNALLCDMLPRDDAEEKGDAPGGNLKDSYLKHNVKREGKIGNEEEVAEMMQDFSEEDLKLAMEESLKIGDGKSGKDGKDGKSGKDGKDVKVEKVEKGEGEGFEVVGKEELKEDI